MDSQFITDIFSGQELGKEHILPLFQFQYRHNQVYQEWCDALHVKANDVDAIDKIPFLPISFFKTHQVVCDKFVPQLIFESSGTTQTVNSRHYVKDASIYEKSFRKGFELFYGHPKDWCIIGLLPAYLERKNSSLIKMAQDLITDSGYPSSGFYLYDFEKLASVLQELERKGQKTLLLGVTFALLDFAKAFPMKLEHTIIMETGGMKGRKKELTRNEVHEILENAFQLSHIDSEYGMTELLSQAYAYKNGIYTCPPWMKMLLRDANDPLQIKYEGQGLVNIIDMANIYSCSFIATDDVGIRYPDGRFEIQGRLDNSDLRGCSLLAI